MHGESHDKQGRSSQRGYPEQAKPDGRGRHPRRACGVIVLHSAARPIQSRRERSVDRQFDAACSLSALLHRGDDRFPRLRLLARLPRLEDGLQRGRGLRAADSESSRQGRARFGNGARRRGARLRFSGAPFPRHMNGEFP
jgi:hypothetical protein